MNESTLMRVAAIACALCVIPGCYLSHGLDDSATDAGPDGSASDGSVISVDGNVDARFFDASVRDVDPARDSGTDATSPLPDAGIVDPPPPGVRAVQLAAGREHVCALGDDGNVYCWGSNATGQSAAGELRRLLSPTRVSGLPPIASIHTMDIHTCAVDLDGGLWCWGFSAYGQLIVDDSEIPECGRAECSRVPLRTPVTQTDHAFIAQHGTCARNMPGEIRCWGEDRAVQDVPLAELTNAQTLDFGLRHGCGLGVDGIVRCFGESEFGRIGEREDGIIGVNNVAALEVGADHSCVLTAEGEVLCWGYDWAPRRSQGRLAQLRPRRPRRGLLHDPHRTHLCAKDAGPLHRRPPHLRHRRSRRRWLLGRVDRQQQRRLVRFEPRRMRPVLHRSRRHR